MTLPSTRRFTAKSPLVLLLILLAAGALIGLTVRPVLGALPDPAAQDALTAAWDLANDKDSK